MNILFLEFQGYWTMSGTLPGGEVVDVVLRA